jgi:hypothetical protein
MLVRHISQDGLPVRWSIQCRTMSITKMRSGSSVKIDPSVGIPHFMISGSVCTPLQSKYEIDQLKAVQDNRRRQFVLHSVTVCLFDEVIIDGLH